MLLCVSQMEYNPGWIKPSVSKDKEEKTPLYTIDMSVTWYNLLEG